MDFLEPFPFFYIFSKRKYIEFIPFPCKGRARDGFKKPPFFHFLIYVKWRDLFYAEL